MKKSLITALALISLNAKSQLTQFVNMSMELTAAEL